MQPCDGKTGILLKIWRLGCSLKLAIVLASLATLLIMGGSLVMHFNPGIFGDMEQEVMSAWLPQAWRRAPLLVAWVPLSGLCVLLLGVNTCCCLLDWLCKLRVRWRKTGEYLVHAGFILLVIAYAWGSVAGFRHAPQPYIVGDRQPVAGMPGYALQLDSFEPVLEASGRPLDMLNRVSLWKDGARIREAEVRINHPLLHDGLVVLATSFGRELSGFRCLVQGFGLVELTEGSVLELAPNRTLAVEKLLPDARRNSQGRVFQGGSELGNPALLLTLREATGAVWQGWYFLRMPIPGELQNAGIMMRPVEPTYRTYSVLTVNRDPGDRLALAGALCMTAGVLLAGISFYRKRARGDRPEV